MAEIRSGYAEGLKPFLDAFYPKEDDTPYYAAIGKFVVQYAAAEGAAHMLARRLTKLKDDKARILFAGMRSADLIDRIRGLWRLSKHSQKSTEDLDDCLAQLKVVAQCRHNLTHRFSRYGAGKISVDNIMTAKNILNAERDEFSLKDLKNLYSDCLTIYLRLGEIYPKKKKKSGHDRLMSRMIHEPWRYKPPSPKKKNQTKRADPR
jgi:hypothetical protein